MRLFTTITSLLLVAAFAGCDLRSETAKREMEKFSGTPTPALSPTPPEAPIDPADVVQADVNIESEKITVNGYDQKKSIACSKLQRVMISGGRNTITIKGACRQIMINGDSNQITSDAAIEIVMNGNRNNVQYSRFVNGKRPIIKDNAGGNTVEKITATGANIESNQRKR